MVARLLIVIFGLKSGGKILSTPWSNSVVIIHPPQGFTQIKKRQHTMSVCGGLYRNIFVYGYDSLGHGNDDIDDDNYVNDNDNEDDGCVMKMNVTTTKTANRMIDHNRTIPILYEQNTFVRRVKCRCCVRIVYSSGYI